ncbi:MAG: cellulose binding domain-containing protein [Chloroflexota bacterium]
MHTLHVLPTDTVYYPNRQDISWRLLNPAPGVYDWDILEGFMDQATADGKLFSFRIYTMRGETFGGHQVPNWVVERDSNIIRNGEPNYLSCSYQSYWYTFVNELRQQYDGDPRIAFMDISGYGNFNEWSWGTTTVWDDNYLNPSSVDGQARVRLADMFIGGSDSSHECETGNGSTQTVSYNYPGFQTTQMVMPYAGVQQTTRYVASQRDDVGIRYDCIGSARLPYEDVLDRIGDVIEETWRTAPIIYEFCSDAQTSASQMADAVALMEATHGTIVHDNLSDTRSFAPVFDLMQNVGYRYVLTQATYPTGAIDGGNIDVSMAWENVGTAPAYFSMGYNLVLDVYLTDANGQVVTQATTSARVDNWMPADDLANGVAPSNLVAQTLTVPANQPQGVYTISVGIRDTVSGNLINLGINGRDANGRYSLGTININNGGGGAPVEPTSAPVQPTSVPVEPTSAPVQPTSVPVQPTSVPVQPTSVPVQPTSVPVQPTSVPVQPTSVPPVADPGDQPACEVFVDTSDNWRTGYVAYFTIQNNTNVAIEGWTLNFTIGRNTTIASSWEVENMLRRRGQATVTALSGINHGNRLIPANGEVTFGYDARHDGNFVAPSGFVLNNTLCNVDPSAPAPVQPTSVPVQPTNVPVQPTSVPVQPTNVPVQPTAVPVQPTTVPPVASGGCSVTVNITDSWNAGYIAEITVTNNSGSRINGWDMTANISGATLANSWSVQNGSQNGNIAAFSTPRRHWNSRINNGRSVSFGFRVDHNGNFTQPSNFTLNGMVCS